MFTINQALYCLSTGNFVACRVPFHPLQSFLPFEKFSLKSTEKKTLTNFVFGFYLNLHCGKRHCSTVAAFFTMMCWNFFFKLLIEIY